MSDITDAQAARIIEILGLTPHPKGGHFREMWRDAPADGGRGSGTAIYFLLRTDEISRWHRVDAAEIWHFYAGAPLELRIAKPDEAATVHRLGPDVVGGERPQILVPPHAWQSAKSLGAWTLVGCTVRPPSTSPVLNSQHLDGNLRTGRASVAPRLHRRPINTCAGHR